MHFARVPFRLHPSHCVLHCRAFFIASYTLEAPYRVANFQPHAPAARSLLNKLGSGYHFKEEVPEMTPVKSMSACVWSTLSDQPIYRSSSPPPHRLPHFTMPSTRRTRSGRAAPSAPTKRIRTKQGCLTCRIRRKKCDESRDFEGGCETCSRLHIECLGYSNKRPDWLKGPRVDDFKRLIKHFLADNGARSSTRSPDQAFLELHHLADPPTPPRQHSESVHTDTDSDYDPDPTSPMDQKPLNSSPLYVATTLPAIPELPVWTDTPVENTWLPGLDFFVYTDDQPSNMLPHQGPHYSPFPSLDYPLPLVSSSSMNHNEHSITMSPELDLCQFDVDSLQVAVAQYEYPVPSESANSGLVWNTNIDLLHWAAGDPEGVKAVSEVLHSGPECFLAVDDFLTDNSAETRSESLRRMRQNAQQRLLKSGYNSPLARAAISLIMMQVTLRQGHFDTWNNCLDIVIEWIRKRLSSPSARVSSLGADGQRTLGRGLWMDLIAAATAKKIPFHIDLYRQILRSDEPVVPDCPNKVTLTFVETIALAANPSHLGQARAKLQQLRSNLVIGPTDDPESISAAQVHTIGISLYLEAVASRDMVNPVVQTAAQAVCDAVSKSSQRDFAFWIFLAGCHTKDVNCWSNCSMMMNELVRAEGGDGALQAGFDIMNETYNNRKTGSAPPDYWVQRMREQNVLLV
ncbi:hypothetical protein RSOLAG1IB_01270 [Rhizoctonia solani AG-1 IB]|uniref:Zn(2)-C6 fungal-type domain-containing protein n=1 Tax=Thanatephorus cucumeris (strain AG1-IB / isolate 7/3/14) TaxID=1108050 RepID=A0A0B7FB23_THACB|nr:hypothetical protein RSOLAG1IB_01270 [Rhizoctonia solani AG-1 IB]